jgi:diguanylate cyclase (GGDEF)-like protein
MAHARSLRPGSLASRLVLATLGFCLVFTMGAVAVRTWSAWRASVSAMASDLAMIERMYQGALAKANWDLDREQVRTYTDILSQAPSVGRVTITLRLPIGPPLVFDRARPGWRPSALAPVRHLPLVYEPFPGGTEPVGELVLAGDERMLWDQLRGELLAIVVAQALQSLLLASLVMLLFNRLVTVHVRRIAHHLAQINPLNLDQRLTLERPSLREDELELLVMGVNELQSNLSDYLQRQQRYEHELAEHRDRLSELVQERTTELEAANLQLETLSRTDALTGLGNRRSFDEVKHMEFLRSRRGGQPLALLLCDIDHFKRFNDTYGHGQGDDCLCRVAKALRQTLQRPGDVVTRIGGEEFAVLLPDTGPEAALGIAQRLRQAVSDLDIAHAGSDTAPHVTLSIGVACLDPAADTTFETLFHRADQALYRAKHDGRNRVAPAREAAP